MRHPFPIRALCTATLALLTTAGCDLSLPASTDTTQAQGGSLSQDEAIAAVTGLVASGQMGSLLFDPGNPTLDKDALAFAIRVETAVKASSGPCVSVTRKDASVSLDFGAGCPIGPSGARLQGKVTVGATIGQGQAVATLVLDQFGAHDKTATGGTTITAKPATGKWDLTIATATTAGKASVSGGLQAQIGAVTVEGAGYQGLAFDTLPQTFVTGADKGQVNVTATGVVQEKAACWPSHGSILFESAGIKSTLTFDATTGTSGVAQWKPPLSLKSEPLDLQARGWNCK
jgi:hypothetical protein